MKVKKVLHRLGKAPEDEAELKRVARALGSELPQQRMEVLRSFRAELARFNLPDGGYAAGYVTSMLDVTAEFEASLREADDEREVTRRALREDWRSVLFALRESAMLPKDLASRLGKDRPTITRILKRMRTAGLVQSFAHDSLDGRMRPHRLTLQGKNLVSQIATESTDLPSDLARGITLAVRFFQQLGAQASSTGRELNAIANEVLQDIPKATNAVQVWAEETRRVGLVDSADQFSTTPMDSPPTAQAMPGGHMAETRSLTDPAAEEADVEERPLWKRIPDILSELEQYRDRDTPIYVRTSDSTWGAWAYALQSGDSTGMSRAIVKGDMLANSLAPPERRFALVYDNPAAIDADREEPAMRAFLERADNKFVITEESDRVPEGFIPLSPLELADEE